MGVAVSQIRAGHFLVNVKHPGWGVWSVTVVSSSGAHIRSSSGERILDLGELGEWAQVVKLARGGGHPALANPKTGRVYTFANLTQANNAVKKLGAAWHVSARYPFTVMFDASKLPANDLRGLGGLGAAAVVEKAVKAGRLYGGSLTCRISDQQKLNNAWRRALAAVERAYPNTNAAEQVIARVEQLGPLTPTPGKDI